MILPDWAQRFAERAELRHAIAELEALANQGEGTLTCHWTGNLMAYMQTEKSKIANGFLLYAAWQEISKAQVVGLIDSVRNRVLEFALKLEEAAPAAGEPAAPGSEVPQATITHLYQTVINGDVIGNVATGSDLVQHAQAVIVQPGDLGSLKKALAASGLPPADVTELEQALQQDPPATTLGERPKTSAWLGKMIQKALSGTLTLAKGATIEVIQHSIEHYLGIK